MHLPYSQIFHVPLEERRYKSNESSAFGCESQQASAIRDIMAKTGCNIETSQSKDLSLTIIVSGKPSSVKEAEKMICTDLLTKVTAKCDNYWQCYFCQSVNTYWVSPMSV